MFTRVQNFPFLNGVIVLLTIAFLAIIELYSLTLEAKILTVTVVLLVLNLTILTGLIRFYREKFYNQQKVLEFEVEKRVEELKVLNKYYQKELLNKDFELVKSNFRLLTNKVFIQILETSLQKLPLPDQLDKILDIIISTNLMNVENCYGGIYIEDSKNKTFSLVANNNLPLITCESCQKVVIEKCTCGLAIAKKEFIFTDTSNSNYSIKLHNNEKYYHYNIPLLVDNKVIGLIVLYLDKNYTQSQEHILYLKEIASLTAKIISGKVRKPNLYKRNTFEKILNINVS